MRRYTAEGRLLGDHESIAYAFFVNYNDHRIEVEKLKAEVSRLKKELKAARAAATTMETCGWREDE